MRPVVLTLLLPWIAGCPVPPDVGTDTDDTSGDTSEDTGEDTSEDTGEDTSEDTGEDSGDSDTSSSDSGDTSDSADSGDSGDSGDSSDSGDTDDTDDSGDSGSVETDETDETDDTGSSGDTGDSSDTSDSGDSADTDTGPRTAMDLTEGDLVITEIMGDPTACPDADAEYVEVAYTGQDAIDLGGLIVASSNAVFNVPVPTLVQPGDTVLFAASASGLTGCYPGVTADHVISTGLTLATSADIIQLLPPSFAFTVAEQWNASSPALRPVPGVAWERDPVGGQFCEADTPLASTVDFGTPGADNGACPLPMDTDTDTDTGTDSDADTDGDTDAACTVPDGTYGTPTAGASTTTVGGLWGVFIQGAVVDGLLDDADVGGVPGAPLIQPETVGFEIMDSAQNTICTVWYGVQSVAAVDPSTWPIGTGSGAAPFIAFDSTAIITDAYSDCPASLTVSTSGGGTQVIDPVFYFSGDWRVGIGALDHNAASLQAAVAGIGGNWAQDWDPYVVAGYFSRPTGTGVEAMYGFLFEQTCQVLTYTGTGNNVLMNKPTAAPVPDSFVDLRVYSLFGF